MRNYILTHGCPMAQCCRRFTTEKYAKWHVIGSHKIKEGPNPIRLKPVEITADKSPQDKGVCIADCPKHRSIALGIAKRHTKCYRPLFKCPEGCVFCEQCKVFFSDKTDQVIFQGGLFRSWKEEHKEHLEFS